MLDAVGVVVLGLCWVFGVVVLVNLIDVDLWG